MRKVLRLIGIATITVFAIVACSAPLSVTESAGEVSDGPLFSRAVSGSSSGGASEYLVVAVDELPGGFSGAAARRGATVTRTIPEIGAAVVTAESRAVRSLSRIRGIRSVVPNIVIEWLPGDLPVQEMTDEIAANAVDPTDDTLAGLQWSLSAIDAFGAWAEGYTGEGVTVAVLDTGVDVDHPDIAPNLSPLSTSFVASQLYVDDEDGHGTHVAGTIAALDNDFGVVGVAPNAEILAVKVLSAEGSGSFADVISGIVYSAAVGADVINMSLGAVLQRRGIFDEEGNKVANANEVAELVNATARAVDFAHKNGALVISSAGNDSLNSTGDSGTIYLPADAGQSMSISATGPLGWFLDPTTDLDVPAFYTNYGNSIDIAAPGGNVDFNLFPDGPWFYDLVLSTFTSFDEASGTFVPSYAFSAGTSMASPHVAGVAALAIEASGGTIKPSQLQTLLARSADDLGKPGNDPFYGAGRLNALNAVTR